MRWSLIAAGGILVLIGVVWTLQGLNILLGSPMTGQPFWAFAGIVCLIAGAALGVSGSRR